MTPDEGQGRAEALYAEINARASSYDREYGLPMDDIERPGIIAHLTAALRAERERALEEAATVAETFDWRDSNLVDDIAQAIREQLRENVTRSRSDVTQARQEE